MDIDAKTMGIIRQFVGRRIMVFNDDLATGVRSLKVPGWTRADYLTMAAALEENGVASSLQEYYHYQYGTDLLLPFKPTIDVKRGAQLRLHVFTKKGNKT